MDYEEACEVLGINPDVEITETDLKKAYKRAAITHHPDKNQGDAQAKGRFQRVGQAFETLSGPVKRGLTGPARPPDYEYDVDLEEHMDEFFAG